MVPDLRDENVLTKFDFLTNEGIVHYGSSTAISLVDKGFPFEFRICPGWSKKPLTVDGEVLSQNETEKFGPGSDINLSHTSQIIGTINHTHVLALNIYPSEALDEQDVEASWNFLATEKGEQFYVMYNCAQEAGCSRNHKHLQILQKPEFSSPENGFRFFPDIKDHMTTVKVPYVYMLHYFDLRQLMEAKETFSNYQELLKKCRKTLGVKENDYETICPHNLILTKDWMMMIPRRRGTYKGVMVNAAGMLGMPTVANEELFAIWETIGPSKALSEFGIASHGI